MAGKPRITCRACGAVGEHLTVKCPRRSAQPHAPTQQPPDFDVDPEWYTKDRDLDNPEYVEWLKHPHQLVREVLEWLKKKQEQGNAHDEDIDLDNRFKELMWAGYRHGPYEPYHASGRPVCRKFDVKEGGRVCAKIRHKGFHPAIHLEDSCGTMRTFNAFNFFTPVTAMQNRLKKVNRAVCDSDEWKGRLKETCTISSKELAEKIVQLYPHVEYRRNGPIEIFEDPQVYTFIRDEVARSTSAWEPVIGSSPGPPGERELCQRLPPFTAEPEEQVKVTIQILRFNRHGNEFREALLQSELALDATTRGLNVEPEWANGAKVLADVREEDVPPGVDLRPYHVLIPQGDVPRLNAILARMKCNDRPLRKGPPVEFVQHVAADVNDRAHTSEVDFVVERTFIHVREAVTVTPRSAYTHSCNDARASNVNPRSKMWAGAAWESAATASCSATPGDTSRSDLVAALKACQTARDLPGALHCYSSLLGQGQEPDEQVFAIIIDVCAKTGELEEAERFFEKMPEFGVQPGMCACNCLINAYAKAGDGRRAEQKFAYMEEHQIDRTATSYACVVRAFAIQGDIRRAAEWIEKAKSAGKVTRLTWAPIIESLTRMARPLDAEKYLVEKRDSGFPWDKDDFGCMVTAHANARDLDRARSWCRRLEEEGGHKLGVYEHTQLLKACNSKSGVQAAQTDEAEDIFRKQLARGIQPDYFNLRSLSSVLGRGRALALCHKLGIDWERVEQEFEARKQELGTSSWKESRLDSDGSFKRHHFDE